jgi:hypothetical protein
MIASMFGKNPSRFQLNNQSLYFLHIPKTAGTTLITILDKYFKSDFILKAHSWNELLPMLPLDFSKYQFVRGHFGYAIVKLISKNPLCITMLRDPIKNSISAYQMLSRQQEDIERFHIPMNKNLSELIEGPYLEGLKNQQTHWLVIEQDILERTKNFSKNQLKDYRPEADKELLPKFSDEKFLKIAKNRISEFAFIGIVEKMEESLFLLHYTFGWKPIRNKVKENTATNSTIELSDKAKNKLSENTKIDQKLYKYATNIFEERYSNMLQDLKEKYYEAKYLKMQPNDAIFEMLKKDYLQNRDTK